MSTQDDPRRLDQSELDRLWDFGDPAGSYDRFVAAAADEADAGRRAELITQAARAAGLRSDFDEGHRLLDSVESETPSSDAVTVRLHLERGRLRNSNGQPEAAVPDFAEAARLAEDAGLTFLAIDAWHMVAIADPDQTASATERGVQQALAADDERTKRWLVSLRNNRGWSLHDAERFDDALAEFRAAHEASLEHGTSEQEYVARWAIARCLRSLGRTDEALAIQRQLAVEDPTDEYVQEEIALLTHP